MAERNARNRIMDLLARRNHSELELRQKLSRWHEEAEVEDALDFARENGWLTPPDELAERVAAELGRKKKGHHYVNRFLRSRGLPTVAKDTQGEVERAREVLAAKLGTIDSPLEAAQRQKAYRLLANRGFDDETIRHVLKTSED